MNPPFHQFRETEGSGLRFGPWAAPYGAPTEIRTLVLALKGLRPGPLDDGGNYSCSLSKIS